MGTPVRITLYARSEEEAQAGAKAAFAEIAALDACMSDYRPESELSALNAAAGRGERKLSPPLFEVLEIAQQYAGLSEGAFDVTVGPLVQLWRKSKKAKALPDPEALRAARERVGYLLLDLDSARCTALLEKEGMALDLGGIGKGYACDRALAVLKRRGISSALVDTGGGMAAGDPPPDRKGWRIQVADREDLVLEISRCGVATSGDWERFVVIDGVRYSHIVDPRTGLGLTDSPIVTVVAPDGAAADALSTSLSVLGVGRGLSLAERLGRVEAWICAPEAEPVQTSGFGSLLGPADP